MKRRLRILWALIRVDAYLMVSGIFRGECRFQGWDESGRLVLVATVTGSIFKDSIEVKRIFYNEADKKNEHSA